MRSEQEVREAAAALWQRAAESEGEERVLAKAMAESLQWVLEEGVLERLETERAK